MSSVNSHSHKEFNNIQHEVALFEIISRPYDYAERKTNFNISKKKKKKERKKKSLLFTNIL